MKRLATLALISIIAATSAVVISANAPASPAQDDVVTMVKKGARKVKSGSQTVYYRSKVGGKWVYRKGKKGGKWAYRRVKRGGKWVYVKSRNFLVGKPRRTP